MSSTPRTDVAICNRVHTPNVFGFKEHDRVEEFVRADFARTLERENAEAERIILLLTANYDSGPNYARGFDAAADWLAKRGKVQP